MIKMKTVGTSSNMKQVVKKCDQVSPDINTIVESVKTDLEILPAFSQSCCIYKVPERLLELNKNAYTPRVVSIGPIHHGNEKLRAMEEHKRMYLQKFLRLTKVSLENFVEVVMNYEKRLRDCYAEAIEFSSEDFVKMILMDTAFVIMILLKNAGWFRDDIDRIFFPPSKIREVRLDMLMLENQLPFFILDELLKLSNIASISMTKLTHMFMKHAWGPAWVTEDISGEMNPRGIGHFIDFLRIYRKPSEEQRQWIKLETFSAPSVKELQQAGVKFGLSSSKRLLDIIFDRNKGRLEFPLLQLHDGTELLFRNLLAFEQCHGCFYLNDYISLMSLLVNSDKDAEILVQNGIIENWLSNHEAVSVLFYNLSKEIFLHPNDFRFSGLIEDLDGYCKRPWNRWKANLKEKYFNTPWAAISVMGAIFLLTLSVIQSVCSIIQVLQN